MAKGKSIQGLVQLCCCAIGKNREVAACCFEAHLGALFDKLLEVGGIDQGSSLGVHL